MKSLNKIRVFTLGCALIVVPQFITLNASGNKKNEIPKHSHSFTISHAIVLPVGLKESFDFIINDFSENYKLTSPAHDYFTVRDKDRIELGSVIDCAEKTENQSIKHEYVVKEIIENELIYYASCPSKSKVELKNKTIDGQSNTHVYWTFNSLSKNESQISIHIVVQFKNVFEKSMIGVVGGMKPWERHCIEEMDGLKMVMLMHFNN